MLYVIVICFSMLSVVLCNVALGLPAADTGLTPLVLSTLLGTLSVIVWDALLAAFVRHLPPRWFRPDSKRFFVGKQERLFYRRIRINEWKSLVPELGVFTNFSKSEFRSPDDPAYLAQFLLESNYGVAIHLSNALLGIAIVTLPWCNEWSVALPIAAVNFLLHLLPAAILRFHTAPLRSIYQKKKRKYSLPS